MSCKPGEINYLNARFIVSPVRLSRPGLLLLNSDDVFIYINTRSMGWAWVVVKTGAENVSRLSLSAAAQQPTRISDTTQVQSYHGNGLVKVETSSNTNGTLVVSEAYDPGWSATIDHNAVKPFPAFGLLTAVPIAAGVHHVVLRYLPGSILAGLFVTCTGLMIAGLFCGYGLSRVVRHRGIVEI